MLYLKQTILKEDFKMLSINITERLITESLFKGAKTLRELKEDTGLNVHIIENCLITLLGKSIIIKEVNKYKFNNNLSKEAKEALTNDSNKMEVKKLLINEAIDLAEGDNLNLYKVSLNEKEEKILNGLLYNVEEFLKSIKNKEKTKNEKIIFWGENTYENLIQNMFN